MPQDVLVIDDDDQVRKFIARGLSRVGFECVAIESGSGAMSLLQERRFDAVICDLHMPEVDGLDVLRFAGTLTPPPPFIMLTGYGSVATAVEAMKHGAADFLEKPASIEELRASIDSVISRRALPRTPSRVEPVSQLVGSERWLTPFLSKLKRIAATDSIVLIDGETGTGKSAVAKEIWRCSHRARGPFVELNCAAVPDTLLENELFGHAKGAFTGATGHVGRVEQAHGGTLFLDEVGELKQELQAKLLHLLQERTFSPIGGSGPKQADVRFIAATNRDLEVEVEAGRFRRDLFYRLNVVGLTIPPLRQRLDDVPVLIQFFRKSVEARVGGPTPAFSAAAVAALSHYDWPGNVRELGNVVERMAVMHSGEEMVELDDLPERIRAAGHRTSLSSQPSHPSLPSPVALPRSATPLPQSLPLAVQPHDPQDAGVSLSDDLRRYERERIVIALRTSGGNKSQAARLLNMKRTTLLAKCDKLGIRDGELGSAGVGDEAEEA
jgi:two-component system nitrogen regulation response regulator NtrX